MLVFGEPRAGWVWVVRMGDVPHIVQFGGDGAGVWDDRAFGRGEWDWDDWAW